MIITKLYKEPTKRTYKIHRNKINKKQTSKVISEAQMQKNKTL